MAIPGKNDSQSIKFGNTVYSIFFLVIMNMSKLKVIKSDDN